MIWFLLKHFQKEERKVDKLSAVEMFKVTHNSTKDGFSEEAKIVIVSHTFSLFMVLLITA